MTRPIALAIASALLLVPACGGSSSGSSAPREDGGPLSTRDGAAGSADDGTVTSPGSDGGSPEEDTGAVDALDGGGGGEASSTSKFATPYFPLAVGLRWQWSCGGDGGVTTASIVSQEVDGGVTVFTEVNPPGCYFSSLDFGLNPGGGGTEQVEVNSAGAWYLDYVFPPQQGATWAAGGASGASYEWDMHYASYAVTAGTFSDCWRRVQVGYPGAWEIYCHGVGMVQGASSWTGATWELVGKSF